LIVVEGSDSGPDEPFLLSVESGERRRLTSLPALTRDARSITFSPDGRTIAFVRAVDDGVDDLYLLPVADGQRIILLGLRKDGRSYFRAVFWVLFFPVLATCGELLRLDLASPNRWQWVKVASVFRSPARNTASSTRERLLMSTSGAWGSRGRMAGQPILSRS